MNKFGEKLKIMLEIGGKSFSNYPSAVLSAVFLSVIAIVTIYKEPEEILIYQSLMLAFSAGAVAGMTFCVAAKRISGKKIYFIGANADTAILILVTFLALYIPGGDDISRIAFGRVVALIVGLLILFITAPGFKDEKPYFNEMFFMTIKFFFMSLIYFLVLMLGFFFVAFSVQSLIYEDMSNKIYSYISILSGLTGFIFFLGYFPDFAIEEAGSDDIAKASQQPKFAKVLFQNIMIPIIAALTVVLFIWSMRILITGNWPPYEQTVVIFTTYALSGIALYFLVSSYESLIVRIYKKAIPYTILVFLGFVIYPLYGRINFYGLRPFEYTISILWIFSFATSLLFIFFPVIKNKWAAYLAVVLTVIYVMPFAGALDFSHEMQTRHLRRVLEDNNMIQENQIMPGFEVNENDRTRITSSVQYLLFESEKDQPDFLMESLDSFDDFRQVFGFSPTYGPDMPRIPDVDQDRQPPLNFILDDNVIPVEGYDYFIPRDSFIFGEEIIIDENGNIFTIIYEARPADGSSPTITVSRNEEIILQDSLAEFISGLRLKTLNGTDETKTSLSLPAGDMSYEWETQEISLKIVFNSVTLSRTGDTDEFFEPAGMYFRIR